jgi:hypothetical protein
MNKEEIQEELAFVIQAIALNTQVETIFLLKFL